MGNNYLLEDDEFLHRDPETKRVKLGSLRNDTELFNEEMDIKHSVIRVKKINLPKSGEDWEILVDGRVALLIKGVRLTKKEKKMLGTSGGLLALINAYKDGLHSVTKIKKALSKL